MNHEVSNHGRNRRTCQSASRLSCLASTGTIWPVAALPCHTEEKLCAHAECLTRTLGLGFTG